MPPLFQPGLCVDHAPVHSGHERRPTNAVSFVHGQDLENPLCSRQTGGDALSTDKRLIGRCAHLHCFLHQEKPRSADDLVRKDAPGPTLRPLMEAEIEISPRKEEP